MKKLLISIFCIGIGCLHAFPAMAEYDDDDSDDNGGVEITCSGRNNCNETTYNRGGRGGTGIGIGIGKGGDAEANARASARAKANANANAYQKQNQGQYQSNVGINDQGQGQSLTNNGPQVEITDTKVITYEAAASSAISPDVSTSQLQVKCPLYIQDGWSVAGSVVGGSASLGKTNSEKIEVCFLLLAAQNAATDARREAAQTAAYCLSFEEAGVKTDECEGWRGSLSSTPESESVAVRDLSVREGR